MKVKTISPFECIIPPTVITNSIPWKTFRTTKSFPFAKTMLSNECPSEIVYNSYKILWTISQTLAVKYQFNASQDLSEMDFMHIKMHLKLVRAFNFSFTPPSTASQPSTLDWISPFPRKRLLQILWGLNPFQYFALICF